MHLNDSFCAGKPVQARPGCRLVATLSEIGGGGGGGVWERRTTFLPYRQVAHTIVEKRPDRKISS